MHSSLEPQQMQVLSEAFDIYASPSKRRGECVLQRQTRDKEAQLKSMRRCPLSPVKARPCTDLDCHCTLSHYLLSLSVPLDSPSQSRRLLYERKEHRVQAKKKRAADRVETSAAKRQTKENTAIQAAAESLACFSNVNEDQGDDVAANLLVQFGLQAMHL